MEGRDVLFLFLISGRIMVVVERMALSFSYLWDGHGFNGQQAFTQSSQNGRVHNQRLARGGPSFRVESLRQGIMPNALDLLVRRDMHRSWQGKPLQVQQVVYLM
jgi:hypothetical protein